MGFTPVNFTLQCNGYIVAQYNYYTLAHQPEKCVIEFGDCRETMRRWKEQGLKAQTCVTSPPYYGLRDYGHDGQIGLEETPEEYIKTMVDVFRCVWDVLKDDGTLWLNIGDSYARAGGWSDNHGLDGVPRGESGRAISGISANGGKSQKLAGGCKTKDLIGIPWMLAFALRADGWYLRQDIIWHKPNPMPESVQDRCTKAHEYIFLLSKSQKYYFDNEAIKEPVALSSISRLAQDVKNQVGSDRVPGKTNGNMKAVGGFRSSRDSFKREGSKRGIANVCPASPMPTHRPDRAESEYDLQTRNKRSVWTVTTKPYKGAHFATFPSALIEPCILAGAPAGGIVLDPFMGSGTTAAVAIANGRDYLGCELNPAYKELQDERIKNAEQEISQIKLL